MCRLSGLGITVSEARDDESCSHEMEEPTPTHSTYLLVFERCHTEVIVAKSTE
jgi:hypothetical protein